jgi:hypothetical protein
MSAKRSKKYILHPGPVISINDGDRHQISYPMLMRLWKVSPEECYNAQSPTDQAYLRSLKNRVPERYDRLIHLGPVRSGEYDLEKVKEQTRAGKGS